MSTKQNISWCNVKATRSQNLPLKTIQSILFFHVKPLCWIVLNCVACQCSSAGNKGHNVWQENIPHNYTTTRSTALLHTLVLMSGYISHLPSYQLEAVSPPSDLWPLITSATTLKSLKSQFFLFLMLSTSSLPCSLSCCHGNICST